jgi:YEATS domain-containing protein 4
MSRQSSEYREFKEIVKGNVTLAPRTRASRARNFQEFDEEEFQLDADENFEDLETIEYDDIKRTIVIGNESNLLKPKCPSGATHKWRVFVHGPADEDLSSWVSHVRFELHHTFNNPTRVKYQPPYEVDEKGWGEFDVNVTIYIKGKANPVNLTHSLKIHSTKMKKGKPDYPYFNSVYQDIVLSGLSREAYMILQENPQTELRPTLRGDEVNTESLVEVLPFVEDEEVGENLINAHNDVKLKISQALKVFALTQREIANTKQEIVALEQKEEYVFGDCHFVKRALK